MALLFVESMDQYGASSNLPQIRAKFEARTAGTSEAYEAGGRFGGTRALIRGAGVFEKFVNTAGTAVSTDELYVGFWLRTGQIGDATLSTTGTRGTIIEFLNNRSDSSSIYLRLAFTSIGRLELLVGAASATIGNYYLYPDRFHWFEIRVVCATSGIFQLYIDGVLVINFSGVTITPSGAPFGVESIRFSPGHAGASTAQYLNYDDILVWDNKTGLPNTFPIGPQRLVVRSPSAAGTTTNWTPSTGANWQAVDEITTAAYSESDYVSTTVLDNTDLYNFQDMPATTMNITAVAPTIVGRGTTAPKRVDVAVRSSATTAFTSAIRDLEIFPPATGTVVFSSTADAGDIVTVNDGINTAVAFTFGGGGGQVSPGASATNSATNLAAAINNARLAGTLNVLATSSTGTVTLTNLNLVGGSIVETADVVSNNMTVTTFSQAVDFNNRVRQWYLPTNPVDSSNWTSVTFNAAEFGFRLRS